MAPEPLAALAYYDEPDEFGALPKPILCLAGEGDGMAALLADLTPVIEATEAFVTSRPADERRGTA